jgi:hypothetical protein
MENSYALSSNINHSKNYASPHLIKDSRLIVLPNENIDNMAPAGSILSTSEDMLKWINAFIYFGVLDSTEILKSDAIRTLRKPYQLIGYRTKKDSSEQLRFLFSGMGWSIYDEFDKLTYTHDGGTDGFKSLMMVIPEEEYGVIVLTNSRSHNFTQAIIDELQYALYNKPFLSVNEEYYSEYIEEEKQAVKELFITKEKTKNNKLRNEQLKEYVGIYENKMYGNVEIVIKNSELKLKMLQHQNNLKATLEYIGNNTFLCSFLSPEFYPIQVKLIKENEFVVKMLYDTENTNYEFQKIR